MTSDTSASSRTVVSPHLCLVVVSVVTVRSVQTFLPVQRVSRVPDLRDIPTPLCPCELSVFLCEVGVCRAPPHSCACFLPVLVLANGAAEVAPWFVGLRSCRFRSVPSGERRFHSFVSDCAVSTAGGAFFSWEVVPLAACPTEFAQVFG